MYIDSRSFWSVSICIKKKLKSHKKFRYSEKFWNLYKTSKKIKIFTRREAWNDVTRGQHSATLIWHSFFKWVYRQQEKVLFFLKYTHVSNYIVFAKGALKIEDCEE